jgi:amino acid transporter
LGEQRFSKKLFVRDATGLVREYNTIGIFMITMGTLMGVSYMLFPLQVWGQFPGANYLLGYAISAIPLFLSATSVYLLAVSMPRSGGPYIWSSRLVSPAIGYIVAWVTIIGTPVSGGTLVTLAAQYIAQSIQLVAFSTHNPALFPIAQAVSAGFNLWVITLVALVVFSLPAFFGGRVFKGFVFFTVITTLLGYVMAIVLLTATPSSSFPALWDQAFGAGAYQQVATAAVKHGWTDSKYLTLSWDAVMAGTVAAMLQWGGLSHWGSWLPGEARHPTRSVLGGTLIAGIVALVLGLALGAAPIALAGQKFVTQLWVGRADLSYLGGVQPGLPILMGVVAPAFGPVMVGIVIVIAAMVSYYSLKNTAPFVVMLSRNVFGLSFDRMFPEKFSELKYNHQPTYAYLLLVALHAFYAILALSVGSWVTLGWYAFATGLIALFIGISCAVMPYSKREIYEAAPKFVQTKVGGIPIVTIIGGASAAFWMFLLANTLKSILDGPNGIIILLMQVLIYFLGGLCLFAYFSEKNMKSKISVQEIYREIPPE